MKRCLTIVVGLVACQQPAPAPRPAHDVYLWTVTNDQGHSGWLLGSVHFAPRGFELDQALVQAFEASDSIAVELDVDAIPVRELLAVFADRGRYPEGQSLRQALGERDFERLKTLLAARGVVLMNLEQLTPWVVALMLELSAPEASGTEDGGAPLGMGVDRYFIARAKAGDKPIRSLETLQEQMDAFSSASESLELQLLRESLDLAESGTSQMAELVNAYFEGDVEEKLDGLDKAEEERKAYWKRLLDDRNVAMADRITELLNAGNRPLVVVGAAHMLGPASIPRQLEQRGYRVEPVEPTGIKVAVAPPPESGTALPTERVVDYSMAWPAEPTTRTVELGGAELQVTQATMPPVQYLLTRSSTPPTMVMSLDKLYESGRLSTEQSIGVQIASSEQVTISGLEANRFVAHNPTVEIHGLQVWADSKLYSVVALVPATAVTDELRADVSRVLHSFALETYTQEQADAQRTAALEVLRTEPEWLFPHAACSEETAEQATELTASEANHCAPDMLACVTSCQSGSALDCMRAGDTLNNDDNEALRRALFARACALGSIEGCTSQAARLLFDEQSKPNWPCAMRTLAIACDHGEPWGCALRGMVLARDGDQAAAEWLARACAAAPSSQACKRARQRAAQLGAD